MVRIFAVVVCLGGLAGCDVAAGGPVLVSGMSPAASQSANSEPQPINSLPPGAEGLPGGPLSTSPNIASLTVGTPF